MAAIGIHTGAHGKSLEEVHGSVRTDHPRFWRRLFAFAGPAYMVSVGYMDPGNWATDLEGGSRFGYELLWVLLLSNLMAVLLQTLAARMGIVSGRDLAQACREMYARPVSIALWLLCEVSIAACDLAEVIGTIIGLNLLFGLPLEIGLIVTLFDTFLLLTIQRLGIRKMEAFILVLVLTIGVCFVWEVLWADPVWREVARGFIPTLSAKAPFLFSQGDALYVAIGILGATVMPHNLYLHSALVQSRATKRDQKGLREACRYNFIDSVVALNAALVVNASILILSAATFFANGQVVNEIQDAYRLLPQFLGTSGASALFAIALLCAGQSSTLTGTLAGQIVMEGFIRFRMRPWMRRLLTRSIAVIPAAVVIGLSGGRNLKDLLIFSQVILSLQLSFAVIPLIQFTSDPRAMGPFRTPLWGRLLAWLVAAIILSLNAFLVFSQIGVWRTVLQQSGHSSLWIDLTAIPLAAACALLLAWLIAEPLWRKWVFHDGHTEGAAAEARDVVDAVGKPLYRRIGVALEHRPQDSEALRHAVSLAQAHGAELLVLHVVDGVGGQWYGTDSHDRESVTDRRYVDEVAEKLRAQGVRARASLRYGNPPDELIKAIKEEGIDLIVLRSHGHRFLADRFFGETIESIRHAAAIPVLAVRETK
jgi:manganese transport protein